WGDVEGRGGGGEAKGDDGHEALAAGEHGSALARNLGESLDRLFDRLGRVISEGRGLHRCSPRIRWTSKQGRTITASLSHIWEFDFFWIDAQLLVYVKKLHFNRVRSAKD